MKSYRLNTPSHRRTQWLMWVPFAVFVAMVLFLSWPYYCVSCWNNKEASRATAALAQVRQIATGCLVYAEDNDGGWPVATIGGMKTALGWSGRLPIKDKGSYSSDPWCLLVAFEDRAALDKLRPPSEPSFPDPGELLPISFAFNSNVAKAPPITKLADPQNAILFFEVEGARAPRGAPDARGQAERLSPVGDGTPGGLRDTLRPGLPTKARYATGLLPAPFDVGPRRSQGAVFAFADGHARKRKPEEMRQDALHWTFHMR